MTTAQRLTARQIQLIQRTYPKLERIEKTFAELFYKRLFDLEPAFREVLARDADGSASDGSPDRGTDGGLVHLIGTVVANLDRLESLAPAVGALGRSRFGNALQRDEYDCVGQALIWTLARALEDEFTDETKLAWLDAYALLASAMERSVRGPHRTGTGAGTAAHVRSASRGGYAAAA